MTIKNIPLGLTENDLKHLTEEGKQFALEIAQTVRSNLADAAHQNEEIEKLAYLCDACDTPFDGAYECPCCGHGTATKRRVFTTPPQPKEPEQEPVACVVPHGATMRLEWASVDAAHNAKIGPLYTTPPQRKPLDIKTIKRIATYCGEHITDEDVIEITRRVEEEHKIKE